MPIPTYFVVPRDSGSYTRGVDRDRRHRDHMHTLVTGGRLESPDRHLLCSYYQQWRFLGIGITPDPFGRGAYNLQSISATRRKVIWFTRLDSIDHHYY